MISAIVLNWNGKDVICACLDSLLTQTYKSYEIIVVDNDSSDGSLEMIKEKYASQIKIIENKKNLGFAEGCNVGIRASEGDLIMLLNSDATVKENWMREMANVMESDSLVGMSAGKIYFSDERDILENTGHIIYKDGLGRGRGRLEKDKGQYDTNNRIFCPNGCAAIYKRKMLEEIGFFDKYFFAYADDIDVGFRGRLLGYDCIYVPSAIAYHKLSNSFGMLSPFKAFLVERNRLWVVIKCFPFSRLLKAPFYTFFRYLFHFYGVFAKKGPASRYVQKMSIFSLIFVGFRVYISTFIFLPHLLIERFKIRKRTKVSNKDFESWFEKFGMTVKEVTLNEISS